MLSYTQAHQLNHEEINFITTLLEEAFPLEERRHTDEFWHLAFSNKAIECTLISYNNIPVGFYYLWHFTHFSYLEFVAIAKEYRSGNIFTTFFEQVLKHHKKPLICEAERKEDEQAQRRLRLYQRLGFSIISDTYTQPPFRATDIPQPMYLLAYTTTAIEVSTPSIVEQLYKNVYGIRDAIL